MKLNINAHPVPVLVQQLLDAYARGEISPVQVKQWRDSMGKGYWTIEFEAVAMLASSNPPPAISSPPPTKESAPADGKIRDLGFSDQVITGFRDFDLVWLADGYTLQSRNKAFWRPRRKMVAFCESHGIGADHDAPGENCACGIYAYSTPDHPDLKSVNTVWGEIALWGEVLICETGYRGEYAYPTNLFLKDTGTKGIRHVKEELEQTYGVPVWLVPERAGKTSAQVIEEIMSGLGTAVDPIEERNKRWMLEFHNELVDAEVMKKIMGLDD